MLLFGKLPYAVGIAAALSLPGTSEAQTIVYRTQRPQAATRLVQLPYNQVGVSRTDYRRGTASTITTTQANRYVSNLNQQIRKPRVIRLR